MPPDWVIVPALPVTRVQVAGWSELIESEDPILTTAEFVAELKVTLAILDGIAGATELAVIPPSVTHTFVPTHPSRFWPGSADGLKKS